MKVIALVPLNHEDKTIEIGECIELKDEGAVKKLIEANAVKEFKEDKEIKQIEGDQDVKAR